MVAHGLAVPIRDLGSHIRSPPFDGEYIGLEGERMKALALKVLIGIGTAAVLASVGLMIWIGFAMSAHGG